MTFDELSNTLTDLGLTDLNPTQKRLCGLYLTDLQQLRTYFRDTLDPAKDAEDALTQDEFRLVGPALQQATLPKGVIGRLERFVYAASYAEQLAHDSAAKSLYGKFGSKEERVAAINAFHTFFDDHILIAGFDRTAFLQRYPRTQHAISTVIRQYKDLVKEVCQRVVKDWREIEATFFPNFKITALQEILATGSDAHKGGRQALILTFEGNPTAAAKTQLSSKLVYKPTDLRVDYYLFGDSTAVEPPDPLPDELEQGMASLIEVLRASQPTELIDLPRFVVLPKSRRTNGQLLPMRERYGYIEFLYSEEGKDASIYRNSRAGASDYVLEGDPTHAARQFYNQIGQIIALSCTFSISDLHAENLIVHQLSPHPIDLEISLLVPMNHVTETALFLSDEVIQKNRVDFSGINGNVGKKNRIYAKSNGGRPEVISPHPYSHRIVEAFEETMAVLGILQDDERLNAWFNHLKEQEVILRVTVLATASWSEHLRHFYDHTNCHKPVDNAFSNEIETYFNSKGDALRNTWKISVRRTSRKAYNDADWGNKQMPYPKFLAFRSPHVEHDIRNLDVPAHYHAMGTRDLLDSKGDAILATTDEDKLAFKDMLSILNDNTEYLKFFPLFGTTPTEKVVRRLQLDILGNVDNRKQRINRLRSEILDRLGLKAKPTAATAALGTTSTPANN